MNKRISVKQNSSDFTNAYTVTETVDYGAGVVETNVFTVHTGPTGNGLWINGVQVEGNSQFSAGARPGEAIRRYFQKS